MYLDATNVAGLQIANANNEQRKAGVNNNNGAAVRCENPGPSSARRWESQFGAGGHWSLRSENNCFSAQEVCH